MGKYLLAAILFLVVVSCKQPKYLVYKGVEHFGMEQVGLSNTTVSMNLLLYNPNHYKLKLKTAAVEVYFNGSPVGTAIVAEQFIIPKQDTFSLPVLLRVNLVHVLPNALQLLLSKQITLKLKGEMRAGRHGVCINIPIDYEGKQNFR